jgi:hypothetical protein
MKTEELRDLYYRQDADRRFTKKGSLQLVINNRNKREIGDMKAEMKFYAKWMAYEPEVEE